MQTLDQLTELRQKIDTIDDQIVTLLNLRAATALEVGHSKGKGSKYRPAREAAVIDRVAVANDGPLSDQAMQAMYREIIGACLNLEQPLSVSFLGPHGTYSEEAARKHFGHMARLLPADSLDEALHMAEKSGDGIVVLPIENSTEGSVGRTLDLLLETPLRICGEINLPIRHQLLSKAASLEDVKEVVAHAQALAQSRKWLARYLPQVVQIPVSSNAEAARLATKSKTTAAIAGKQASAVYELPILGADIQDEATNTTRFIILGHESTTATGRDKTSLVCSAPNRPGALHDLLGALAEHAVNIVKLEPRPATHAMWEYVFYMDVDGHREDTLVAHALESLEARSSYVKVLGSYPKAR